MPRIIHRKRVYGCPIFEVEECGWKSADGLEVSRSLIRHPGAVLIVPVLDDDHLVLIQNHRVAVGEALWEFPAGTLETGEPPVETAGRELSEETGYGAGAIRSLGSFYTSPGFTDELMHVFEAVDLQPGQQHLEVHEEIEVATHSVTDVGCMVEDGRLQDGKSIAALWLWERSRASQPESTAGG